MTLDPARYQLSVLFILRVGAGAGEAREGELVYRKADLAVDARVRLSCIFDLDLRNVEALQLHFDTVERVLNQRVVHG